MAANYLYFETQKKNKLKRDDLKRTKRIENLNHTKINLKTQK